VNPCPPALGDPPAQELIDARKWYYTGSPVCPFACLAARHMIFPALLGRRHVHLINVGRGPHPPVALLDGAPGLLGATAGTPADPGGGAAGGGAGARRGGRGEGRKGSGKLQRLRITHLNPLPLLHSRSIDLESTKATSRLVRGVEHRARQLGVEFAFVEVVLEEGDSLGASLRQLEQLRGSRDEVVAVCSTYGLKQFSDSTSAGGGSLLHLLQVSERNRAHVGVHGTIQRR